MRSSLSSHDKPLYLPALVFCRFRSKLLWQGPLCCPTGHLHWEGGWGERWRRGECSAPTALINKPRESPDFGFSLSICGSFKWFSKLPQAGPDGGLTLCPQSPRRPLPSLGFQTNREKNLTSKICPFHLEATANNSKLALLFLKIACEKCHARLNFKLTVIESHRFLY